MPLTLASWAGVVPLGTIAMVIIGEVAAGSVDVPPGVVPTRGVGTIRLGSSPDPHATPAVRRTTTIAAMGNPARTFAKFTFFKLDPAWQRRDPEARAEDKREFLAACEDFAQDRSLRAYSTVGTRGDTDLLLLAQSPTLEDIHTFHVVLAQSGLAKWMSIPHSYLAMTKRSPYSESEARPEICTSERRYLFVYPFEKKREWYRLAPDERQRIMDEHIAVGRRYPEITINTAYSFGLDDQEFVVSFEADDPGSSSIWSRSCAGRSRAPTRCGTRRSSPAWRCPSPRPWTRSTEPRPRAGRRRRAPLTRAAPRVPGFMSDQPGTAGNPLRVAIVGSGPAGFYAAEHLLQAGRVRPSRWTSSTGCRRRSGWCAPASRPTTRRSSR